MPLAYVLQHANGHVVDLLKTPRQSPATADVQDRPFCAVWRRRDCIDYIGDLTFKIESSYENPASLIRQPLGAQR
jgi:hypothetical protein